MSPRFRRGLTPLIVTLTMNHLGYSHQWELVQYVSDSRKSYDELQKNSAGHDFTRWLAFKLSCTPAQARRIITWADGKAVKS